MNPRSRTVELRLSNPWPAASAVIGLLLTALALVLGTPIRAMSAEKPGRIVGQVADGKTGEVIIGASIYLEGTNQGAVSDIDGKYLVRNVQPGTYSLRAQAVGYAPVRVTDVVVTSGEATNMSFELQPTVADLDTKIVVTAKAVQHTEAVVLKQRQSAAAVTDAVSSDQMARAGSGDAAEAMTKVVGASVVGGKYVYIRGLGDRYSNTMLNGTPLPSPDPDKQAAQMDMIPSGMLDNISVTKSFTPDKPGDFAGGSVNMASRDFPDHRAWSFSASTSYNSNTTGRDDVLSYTGGSKDWIGIDDGTREVPDYLANPQYSTPNPIQASRDSALAAQLDRDSKRLNSSMNPGRRTAPLNQAYSMSFGDTWSMFGRPFGLSASLSYSRNHTSYRHGTLGQWVPLNITGTGYVLDSLYRYTDEMGRDEVLWGGMAHAAYNLNDLHRISATYVYNRNGESTARYVSGWNYNLGEGAAYRTRSLLYNERWLSSGQLRGEHANIIGAARLEWQMAETKTSQDEPDLRYFSDNATAIEGTTDSSYGIYYVYPAHYFRYITERNRTGQLDLTIPLKLWGGLTSKAKVGGSFLHKTREFRERQFTMNQPRVNYSTNRTYRDSYAGDPDVWLDNNNLGVVADTTLPDNFVDLGVTWSAFSDPAANYDACQDVVAAYTMIDMPVSSRLQVITGVRYETTRMTLDQIYRSDDTTSLMDHGEVLPSLNAIYRPDPRMNIRGAYGRTLARPSFRELAPYASWEFVGGSFVMGNRGLEYTTIDNYDLRWEWFPRSGELFAVSVFYKSFHKPIERVILNTNYDISWQNVDRGTALGLELEWRKQLDGVHSLLRNIRVGGNLSLIRSRVKLSETELIGERALDPNANDSRQLQGQSPYLINADISYSSEHSGTSVSILYNRFGKRLSEVSLWANPDIFEVPRTTVDVTLSQRIWRGVTFKSSVKNLTNTSVRKVYDFNGREYVSQEYSLGRIVGFGLSCQF